MNKILRREIDGVILVNKPLGLSSNQALQQVKRTLRASKAGHTGSLDPLATGLLPICLGEATKFAQYLLDADKSYLTTATLGAVSSTGDAEGPITAWHPVPSLTITDIEHVLAQFRGVITQVPPMYSALKHQGVPLYTLARRGETVAVKPRQVTISRLTCLNYTDGQLQLEVHCSKGTYIRSLVQDIGMALGCGAYVSALHRTQVAQFTAATMHTMAELQMCDDPVAYCLPVACLLQHLPEIHLTEEEVVDLQQGKTVAVAHDHPLGLQAVYTQNAILIGVGEIVNHGILRPKRLCKVVTKC